MEESMKQKRKRYADTGIICDVCQIPIKTYKTGMVIWYFCERTHRYCNPHVAHQKCSVKFGYFNDQYARQSFPLDFARQPEVLWGILKHLDDSDYGALVDKLTNYVIERNGLDLSDASFAING
jgi:hypothetical protein